MDENSTGTVDVARALRFSAVQQAPSLVDGRPWRWAMDSSRLRLHLERDGAARDRLAVISCGAALHHARIVLAACGVLTVVRMQPDPREPDLLAELEPVAAQQCLPDELDMFAAIGCGQRPGAQALTPAALQRLRTAASAEGAHLDETGTAHGWCAVIVTRTDDHTAWLNAGKALSAVLLTAADAGLAAAPERAGAGMAGRLPAGFGYPQVGVRIGHPASRHPVGSLDEPPRAW